MNEPSTPPQSDPPQSTPSVPTDPRRARVDAAVARWTEQLIDLGGSNRLLHYRDLKVGTLDLSDETVANRAALDQLRGGRKTRLRTLVPDTEAAHDAARRLRAIAAKARENHEERGIQTLYLAVGMATWQLPAAAPANAAAPAAPVLLLPLRARRRDAAGEDFDLDLDGDPELNPVLVHFLATQHGVALDPDAILAEATPEGLGAPDAERVCAAVAGAAAGVTGFAVQPRTIIANFTFAKLPMVRDLDQARDRLAAHDLVAAIAGDPEAQQAVRANRPEVDPALPDRTPPGEEFLVLPADGSQHHVINRALAGEDVVIQGPPGTGKSQTIANLITTLAAQGRSVLFVAEKRAAIDAVVKRIEQVGLGDIVLDLHRESVTRARVAARLAAALESARASTAPDQALLHTKLVRQRDALVAHDAAMHRSRAPWGLSFYELQARILAFPASARTTLRFGRDVIERLDATTLEHLVDDLQEYLRVDAPGLATSGSPWATGQVGTPEAAERAREWATYLVPVTGDLAARLDAVTIETGLRAPATIGAWRARLAQLGGVLDTLLFFNDDLFSPDHDLDALVRTLQEGGGLFGLSGAHRAAKRQAEALCRRGPVNLAEVTRRLQVAVEQRNQWVAEATDGRPPRVPPSLHAAQTALEQVDEGAAALRRFLPWLDLDGRSPVDLAAWAGALAGDQQTLFRLPRIREIEAAFEAAGATSMLEFARAERLTPEHAAECLRYAWHLSIYDAVGPAELGAFDGAVHTDRQQQFQVLDREHLTATVERVRRAVAERATDVRNRHPEQSQLVENQAHRKRGHLPLRRLVQQAPDVLAALQPCWTMSPLLVSQLLPADRAYFDVVIFDEASQVTPADAVPALLRGRQVVVAGDSRQLPPTAFFATDTAADRAEVERAAEPDEAALDTVDLGLTEGYESVLDVVASLLRPGHLNWHYRSRDERLIAFSNRHVYDGRLTTFPGNGSGGGVHHELVRPAEGTAPADAEAARVVDLVLEHARSRPGESLGVITMGITHAERIGEALRTRLADEPDLAPFFDEQAPERFFVKNLERVQGDERDAIILSIGYGRGADGKLRYHFGPLLQAGGERRLNVAVTRARTRLTVASTFTAADLDPERTTAPGVQLLRAYLDHAASGARSLGDADADADGGNRTVALDELDPFQRYVHDWLVAAGLPVLPRYGDSAYRIDFAVAATEPSTDGAAGAGPAGRRLALAIESDGPAYHAGATARDRDRLRQEVLERLGWRFHRIWSTAFYRDPRAETDRAVAAWRAAVDELTAADAAAAAEPVGGAASPSPSEPAKVFTAADVVADLAGPTQAADAAPADDTGPDLPGGAAPTAAAATDGLPPRPPALAATGATGGLSIDGPVRSGGAAGVPGHPGSDDAAPPSPPPAPPGATGPSSSPPSSPTATLERPVATSGPVPTPGPSSAGVPTIDLTGSDAVTRTGPPRPAPVAGPGAADPAGGRSGPCPVAADGRPITAYRDDDLLRLVLWIESDTRLRTDDELRDEAVKVLGYQRQGPRIVERLDAAIATARSGR